MSSSLWGDKSKSCREIARVRAHFLFVAGSEVAGVLLPSSDEPETGFASSSTELPSIVAAECELRGRGQSRWRGRMGSWWEIRVVNLGDEMQALIVGGLISRCHVRRCLFPWHPRMHAAGGQFLPWGKRKWREYFFQSSLLSVFLLTSCNVHFCLRVWSLYYP